jgi:hypothetical protein
VVSPVLLLGPAQVGVFDRGKLGQRPAYPFGATTSCGSVVCLESVEQHLAPLLTNKDATGCIRVSEKTTSRQFVNTGSQYLCLTNCHRGAIVEQGRDLGQKGPAIVVKISMSISKKFAKRSLAILMLVAVILCLTSIVSKAFVLIHGEDVPIMVLGQSVGTDIKFLDVNANPNPAAWFSSTLLLLCSGLLAVITSTRKRVGDYYTTHWGALSIIFVLMSLDEAAEIHDLFIEPLRSLLNTGGLFYFAWVIPGGAFVAIFVLAYTRFLFYLPIRFRRLFIAAGAVYVLGALGMEMLGGLEIDLHHGKENLPYLAAETVEEFLEMSGVILFLYSLMEYIRHSEEANKRNKFVKVSQERNETLDEK